VKTFSKNSRLLVGAVAMVTFAVMAAVPASAAATSNNLNAGQKVKYVALGDSYAYGVGANDPATESYPADLDAARADIVLTANLAESGATMSDVINIQLPSAHGALKNADLVTLTVGGNDLNVAGIAAVCAPAPTPACQPAIDGARSMITSGQGQLIASIVGTLQAVRAAAPHAQIVVTGYPLLFDPALGLVDPVLGQLAGEINYATSMLNSFIQLAASQVPSIDFVDPAPAFEGHGIGCTTPGCSWIHFGDADSFHPTTTGYLKGYYPAIDNVLASAHVRAAKAA
jgi:lysophospholipase L1-like esterase